jgi:hypothetical protein
MVLDPRKIATVITGTMDRNGQDDTPMEGDPLKPLAEDLIDAVQRRSAVDVIEAFRALFLACESQPHEESGEDDES